jgi:cytoskeletal protein CcmA (bactofilin family)
MGNTNDRLAISLFAEAGSVNGDVYVFDGQLIIDSKVIGDLPAAGDRVRKSGTISEDARVIAYYAEKRMQF